MNNSRGRFWLLFSAFGGSFWGSIIGLIITIGAGLERGYLGGVIFGWVIYTLILILGGIATTASIASEYRMH